jgi:hypothetical protein
MSTGLWKKTLEKTIYEPIKLEEPQNRKNY